MLRCTFLWYIQVYIITRGTCSPSSPCIWSHTWLYTLQVYTSVAWGYMCVKISLFRDIAYNHTGKSSFSIVCVHLNVYVTESMFSMKFKRTLNVYIFINSRCKHTDQFINQLSINLVLNICSPAYYLIINFWWICWRTNIRVRIHWQLIDELINYLLMNSIEIVTSALWFNFSVGFYCVGWNAFSTVSQRISRESM